VGSGVSIDLWRPLLLSIGILDDSFWLPLLRKPVQSVIETARRRYSGTACYSSNL